jgi:cell division protease FtsH
MPKPNLFLASVVLLFLLFLGALAALLFPGVPPLMQHYLPVSAICIGAFLFLRLIIRAIRSPRDASERKPLTIKDKHTSAVHEIGHAFIIARLGYADRIQRVDIHQEQQGDGELASVVCTVSEDVITTKKELLDHICIFLAGRCAELLILGDVSDCAEADVERATTLANRIVREVGMSELFPNRHFDEDAAPAADHTAQLLDLEIQDILDTCMAKNMQSMQKYRDTLNRMARTLFRKNKLEGETLAAFLKEIASGETT